MTNDWGQICPRKQFDIPCELYQEEGGGLLRHSPITHDQGRICPHILCDVLSELCQHLPITNYRGQKMPTYAV